MSDPSPNRHRRQALSPVAWLGREPEATIDEDAIALCLSGGGYRAMRAIYDRRLFHGRHVSELSGPTFVINSTDLRTAISRASPRTPCPAARTMDARPGSPWTRARLEQVSDGADQ